MSVNKYTKIEPPNTTTALFNFLYPKAITDLIEKLVYK